MLDGPSDYPPENRSSWRALLATLVVSLTSIRLLYLAFLCPLDLAPDEAHYWDWSRNLDWSYYSKGPLVAWLIRGSCELFGPLSVSWTGNEMVAVRLPAVLFGALLLVGLYAMTVQAFRSERLAFFVALVAATLPPVAAGSLLMTIDSPFVCLWCWALVVGHRAVIGGKRWAWPVVGLLVGLGVLAKYTMGLWILSLGLFLIFTPQFRRLIARPGPWVMAAVTAFCCAPIIYWNATHDWVTFRHVAGQAGMPGAGRTAGFRWGGPLAHVAGQFGLLLGYWFVVWICAMTYYRPTRETDPAIRYLWWMSAPTFLIFLVASFRSAGQINWPVAGYLSGGVLAAGWLWRAVESPAVGYRRLAKAGLGIACALGLALTVLTHESRLARPVMLEVARQFRKDDPFALRSVDPTCRLRGWKHLGREVDRVREELRSADADEPLIAGSSWNLPGEIGFYCQGHPTVYSLGPYFGDRHSQYDFWRPNPVADAARFAGRTFIIINGHEPTLRQAFGRVGAAKEVVHHEDGVPVAVWRISVCRDYRGISYRSSGGLDRY